MEGIIGYFIDHTRFYDRILLFAAALLLIKPGWATDVIGILCIIVAAVLQIKRTPRPQPGVAVV